jgi:hypothetical protein
MKKKIYLCLLGGLGNQLFQYAYARNLQIKYGLDLILDNKTGFILDFRDKRKFELKNISHQTIKKFTPFFLLFKIYKKLFKLDKKIFFFFKKKIFNETDSKFFKKSFLSKIRTNELYLHGFFQSEKYFKENKKLILQDLYPKRPNNKNFTKLISIIRPAKDVAICIRLFSEVEHKSLSKIGGKLDVRFFNKKLKFFKNKIQNPHFYIFTNEATEVLSNFLKKLNVDKKDYTLITPDRGFKNSYDTLWLLSNFKYQIISNSTFYWWGAYFAKQRFKKVFIKYPNNFPNRDTIYKGFF